MTNNHKEQQPEKEKGKKDVKEKILRILSKEAEKGFLCVRKGDLARMAGGQDKRQAFESALRELESSQQSFCRGPRVYGPSAMAPTEADVYWIGGRACAKNAAGETLWLAPANSRMLMPGDRVQGMGLKDRAEQEEAEFIPLSVKERKRRWMCFQVEKRGSEWRGTAERRADGLTLKINDAEAKKAGLAPGMFCVGEIDETGLLSESALLKIKETLGTQKDKGIESLIAMKESGLGEDFPQEAKDEAKAASAKPAGAELGRVDWRQVGFCTIDGEKSRDYDDAVFGEKLPNGGWRLLVAIADVSSFVKQDSPLDIAAQKRMTSVYLPHRVLPMLPEEISNGACSLNPNEDRLALGCEMIMKANGEIERYDFKPALINSKARLTYSQVNLFLGGEEKPEWPAMVRSSLAVMEEIRSARKEHQGRKRLELAWRDKEPVMGADGKIESLRDAPRGLSERLIEECMLAANICAAEFLRQNGQAGFFRNHAQPNEEKRTKLAEALLGYEIHMDLEDGSFRETINSALRGAENSNDYGNLRSEVLKSMGGAEYASISEGHFSLGEENYTHFTSPIRRYPDLVAHRLIKAALEKRLLSEIYSDADLMKIAKNSTLKGKQSHEAELDARKMLMADFAQKKCKPGEESAAKIVSVGERGVWMEEAAIGLECFVPAKKLKFDNWSFQEKERLWRKEGSEATMAAGDEVVVKHAGVDWAARKVLWEGCRPKPGMKGKAAPSVKTGKVS